MRDFVNPLLETWAGRTIAVVTIVMLLVIGGCWVKYYSDAAGDPIEETASVGLSTSQ